MTIMDSGASKRLFINQINALTFEQINILIDLMKAHDPNLLIFNNSDAHDRFIEMFETGKVHLVEFILEKKPTRMSHEQLHILLKYCIEKSNVHALSVILRFLLRIDDGSILTLVIQTLRQTYTDRINDHLIVLDNIFQWFGVFIRAHINTSPHDFTRDISQERISILNQGLLIDGNLSSDERELQSTQGVDLIIEKVQFKVSLRTFGLYWISRGSFDLFEIIITHPVMHVLLLSDLQSTFRTLIHSDNPDKISFFLNHILHKHQLPSLYKLESLFSPHNLPRPLDDSSLGKYNQFVILVLNSLDIDPDMSEILFKDNGTNYINLFSTIITYAGFEEALATLLRDKRVLSKIHIKSIESTIEYAFTLKAHKVIDVLADLGYVHLKLLPIHFSHDLSNVVSMFEYVISKLSPKNFDSYLYLVSLILSNISQTIDKHYSSQTSVEEFIKASNIYEFWKKLNENLTFLKSIQESKLPLCDQPLNLNGKTSFKNRIV